MKAIVAAASFLPKERKTTLVLLPHDVIRKPEPDMKALSDRVRPIRSAAANKSTQETSPARPLPHP